LIDTAESGGGNGKDAIKSMSYLVTTDVFNCVKNTFTKGPATIYYTDGTKETMAVDPDSEVMKPISPDHFMMKFVCAWGDAHGLQWWSLGALEDGKREYFVDVSSIRLADGIGRAWINTIFKPHTKRGLHADATKWMAKQLMRSSFNCSDETTTSDGLVTYYDDGTVGTVPAEANSGAWQPVPPDTMLSAEMQFVCAWKPK
jgi:hypothetical protein